MARSSHSGVVARRAQHCLQPVASLAFQMATVHPVVGLEVSDHGLDGIAPLDELEPFIAVELHHLLLAGFSGAPRPRSRSSVRRPTRPQPSARLRQCRPKQIRALNQTTFAVLVSKSRRQRRFDLRPRHARGQHGQRVTQVHHAVQPGAEEVVCGHQLTPKTPRNRD